MKDVPPGYPTLLKPENGTILKANVVDRPMYHLSSCLTGAGTNGGGHLL